jgi:hypothetical protein
MRRRPNDDRYRFIDAGAPDASLDAGDANNAGDGGVP